MEIKITAIGDKGDLNNERIGFSILNDCNLKYFLVIKAQLNSTGFYHKSKDMYWFLPQIVKKGDSVVLYTKKGNASIDENKDGTKTYFYYWDLSEAIFTADTKGVALIEAKTWQLSKDI